MIIAIVAVGVALVNLGITINKISNIKQITGYAAADTGQANLTITSLASIAFVTNTVDWGSGHVNETPTSAYMDTEGNVVDGNWSAVSQGLTLQNDGNCNVTFTLTTSNDADGFIGGSASTNNYKIKISVNETDACQNMTPLSSYTEATASAQDACGTPYGLGFTSTLDAIDVDINITIPEDATSGAKGSIITASANCI